MVGYIDEASVSEILSSVQSEILNVCENKYYEKAYMSEERSYWTNIPLWMYEDRNNKNIRTCLDIGCGYGTLLLAAKKIFGCKLFGLDYMDAYMSKKIIDKYDIDFRICNVETEPIPWEYKFDIILLTEVIEHFNFNVVVTLMKIINSLSDNGILYLSTPDSAYHGKITQYYSSYKQMPGPDGRAAVKDCHVYVFDKNELIKIFDDIGLTVERYMETQLFNFNFKLRKRKNSNQIVKE